VWNLCYFLLVYIDSITKTSTSLILHHVAFLFFVIANFIIFLKVYYIPEYKLFYGDFPITFFLFPCFILFYFLYIFNYPEYFSQFPQYRLDAIEMLYYVGATTRILTWAPNFRSWAYGPNLVWACKLNINISPQNCWRGGSPKIFFRTYQKTFSGHTKYFSTNKRKFCRTYQKICPNT
jgi:hypothetical protein